jgi:hypothetical protein
MIWHVNSATGSDAHAVEVAKAGDTILIAPGTYDQDLPGQVGAARAADVIVSVAGSG